MWQRVQTLYLAISSILIASMFFCRFATVTGADGAEADIMYYEKIPYLIFLIMLLAADVSALFAFKARILQMRVSTLAAILMLAFQIWIGVDVITHRNEMVFSLTAVFPIVCVILNVLAARAILTDEAMVLSASRLRSAKRRRDKKA